MAVQAQGITPDLIERGEALGLNMERVEFQGNETRYRLDSGEDTVVIRIKIATVDADGKREFANDAEAKYERDLTYRKGEVTWYESAEAGQGSIGYADIAVARKRAALYMLAVEVAAEMRAGATLEDLAAMMHKSVEPLRESEDGRRRITVLF